MDYMFVADSMSQSSTTLM